MFLFRQSLPASVPCSMVGACIRVTLPVQKRKAPGGPNNGQQSNRDHGLNTHNVLRSSWACDLANQIST